jgi:hypothetical protein
VRRGDGLEALLTRRVPDLRFHGAACLEGDWFSRKFHTDSRMFILGEGTLNVATQEMGLADARVTDKNDFEQKVVVFVVTRIHFLNNN